MEEVVLRIGTICGLGQDSSLPRIRRHPIRTEVRSHIGHRVISGDLVSLADTLTPFRRTKGNMANLYVYPFPRINCRFALHGRSPGKEMVPLPILPSLHSVRVATLIEFLWGHRAKTKWRSRHVDGGVGLVTERLLRISPGSAIPYKHFPEHPCVISNVTPFPHPPGTLKSQGLPLSTWSSFLLVICHLKFEDSLSFSHLVNSTARLCSFAYLSLSHDPLNHAIDH